MKYIRFSHETCDATLIGGKAAMLAKLQPYFLIPQWFVVLPTAYQANEAEVESEVKQALLQLGNGLYAVRSSAIDEDGQQHSFAGQLASFLQVTAVDVMAKVKAVWQSGFTETLQNYRLSKGLSVELTPPAVIVQQMIAAEKAGIAFSADPVSGELNHCIIVAGQGTGEKLALGETSGDTYIWSQQGKLVRENLQTENPVLSVMEQQQVLQRVQQVTAYLQFPQDIEWAMADGECYLLQARPITSLKQGTYALWDNSNIVESYSGVTSPLTFSFARYVYQEVYQAFCAFMGVSRQQIQLHHDTFKTMLGYVNGHIYYNLTQWYRLLSLFPGFQLNRQFMEQMMGVSEALPESVVQAIAPVKNRRFAKWGDAISLSATIVKMLCQLIKLPITRRRFYQRLSTALSVSHVELEKMSIDELVLHYRSLERSLLTRWDAPLVNDFFCMIAFGLSRRWLEKALGEKGLHLHNDYMIGQGDIISAEPAKRLKTLAVKIAMYPNLINSLQQDDATIIAQQLKQYPAIAEEINAYLTKFGDRCTQELKLESMTLHEDPLPLYRSLGNLASKAEMIQMTNEQEHDLAMAVAGIPGNFFKRSCMKLMLMLAKKRVRDRENLRFERTRLFGHVRRIFLQIGRQLTVQRIIAQPRDIFLLEVQEVLGIAEGTLTVRSLSDLIKVRQKDQQHYLSLPSMPNRFATYGAAWLNFDAVNRQQSNVTDNHLTNKNGLGCCQGIVRGKVRIIQDPRHDQLLPGEIMVACYTDPGWVTLFTRASGILIERGSLLSHSAIVARELGIPAIVGLSGVMTWLKTGDEVEMDGATGIVRKINNEQ